MDGEMYFIDELAVWVDQSGIVFSAETFPDSDEIEHVIEYHAGKYCPVWSRPGVTGCQQWARPDYTVRCHDAALAGTW